MLSISRKVTLSAALMTLLSISSLGIVCIAADDTMDGGELVTILKAAKVVPAESKLTASISGDEVVITTSKKAGATDDACKIQAVLIAKTVFESVKNDAQRTKVIFLDFNDGSWNEVSVKRAEVKMFGSGQLTEKELLSSLELKKGDTDRAEDADSKVAAGWAQPERMILKSRINKLEKAGSSVNDLKPLFEKLEQTAQTGTKQETREQLRALRESVDERQKALMAAKDLQQTLVSRGSSQNKSPNRPQERGSGGAKHFVSQNMLGPDGKIMYDFQPADVPTIAAPGGIQIRYYLACIHKDVEQKKNVSNGISQVNGAIHAIRMNDSNQFNNYMKSLGTLYGAAKRMPYY